MGELASSTVDMSPGYRPLFPAKPLAILSIQYLRGVAALMVVWHHAATQVPGMSMAVPWMFGTSGVDLFFVISGFIMFTTASGTDVLPLQFWRRRIVRVVPLYWALTIVMVIASLCAPSLFKTLKVEPGTLLKSLLFIPHFSLSFPGQLWPLLVPGWTLNFEMFFYAVFGAALALPARARLVALTALFLLLPGIGFAFGPFSSPAAQTYTHPMLLEFLSGIWIAVWWRSSRMKPTFGVSCVLLGGGSILLLSRDSPAWGYLPQVVGATLVVVAALHERFNTWHSKTCKDLGDSSYSLYLTHLFTLGALRLVWVKLLPSTPNIWLTLCFMTVALIACAVVGWLTYQKVELPLLAVLNEKLTIKPFVGPS